MATGLFAGRERLLAGTDETETGRQHQTLLRTADGEIDTPLIHAEIDTADRAHAIDSEQGRMARVVENAAHGGKVARDPGRRFVMRDQHHLDRMGFVGLQDLGVALERDTLPPRRLDQFDVHAVPPAEFRPQMTELAEACLQHGVAGRQGIRHGGFPAATAGRREDENLAAFGLEDALQIGQQRFGELREIAGAVILERYVHCASDALGDVGGSRDEQEISSRHGDYSGLRSATGNRSLAAAEGFRWRQMDVGLLRRADA